MRRRLRFDHRWQASARLLLVVLAALGQPSAGLAVDAPGARPAPTASTRARIGLALGGGGARGAAHIGVLEALEELRVPVDVIAGTSIGAIVGGTYAAGVPTAALRELFVTSDWNELFRDTPPRRLLSFRRKEDDVQQLFRFRLSFERGRLVLPGGALGGQKLGVLLRTLVLTGVPDGRLESLRIPFGAVATDLSDGGLVVLRSGDLVDALRASMAVPGVFAPIVIDGRRLVDGGLAANLPVEPARRLGAEVVIAVDVGTPLVPADQLRNVLEISGQATSLMTVATTNAQRALLAGQDLIIEPQLGALSSADFARAAEAIEAGRAAVFAQRERLAPLALTAEAYEAWRAGWQRPAGTLPRVASIAVGNASGVDPRLLVARLRLHAGDPLDLVQLNEDLSRLYDLDRFERVDFSLEPRPEGVDLRIETTPKATGRSFLKIGLSLTSDLRDTGTFNALASYTRTWLGRWGAEWKTLVAIGNEPHISSELLQPLGHRQTWFVLPRVEYGRQLFDLFSGEQRLAQFRVRSAQAGLYLGRQFGPFGEWRAGYSGGDLAANARISLVPTAAQSARRTAWTTTAAFDQLDNVNFPRRGGLVALRLESVRSAFEETVERYRRGELSLLAPYTRGNSTLLFSLDAATAFGARPPVFDQFVLGGLYRVSGLRPGQILASTYGTARIVSFRQLAALPGAFGTGVYLGASAEFTRARSDEPNGYADRLVVSGALFVGADTLLGPLYLAFGQTDRGEGSAYLYLGQTF